MFYQRTAPRPDANGPARSIVESIQRPRAVGAMHPCIRELTRLPEFFISNAEVVATDIACAICLTGVDATDPVQHFRALPCGHGYHEACIAQLTRLDVRCSVCRLVY